MPYSRNRRSFYQFQMQTTGSFHFFKLPFNIKDKILWQITFIFLYFMHSDTFLHAF